MRNESPEKETTDVSTISKQGERGSPLTALTISTQEKIRMNEPGESIITRTECKTLCGELEHCA